MSAPEIGAWDDATRGFWTGGNYLPAGRLTPGDVFRNRTYTGCVVASVRHMPAWRRTGGDEIWPEYVEILTAAGRTLTLSPDQLVELTP